MLGTNNILGFLPNSINLGTFPQPIGNITVPLNVPQINVPSLAIKIQINGLDNSQKAIQDTVALLAEPQFQSADAEIVIIGHSLGGDTALKVAQATSTEIDLLALLDPVGFTPQNVDKSDVTLLSPIKFSFPGLPLPEVVIPNPLNQNGAFTVDLPRNSVGETIGFFGGHDGIETNLSASQVPANVKYFYNRYQTNAPYPLDSLPDRRRDIADTSPNPFSEIGLSINAQDPQETRENYYPINASRPLDLVAFFNPKRLDLTPINTRTEEIIPAVKIFGEEVTPAVNVVFPNGFDPDFLKSDAQLHFDFPRNQTVQDELISILRALDPRAKPDKYEDNNTTGTATPLASSSPRETGLTIHDGADIDYFKYIPSDDGVISISLNFAPTDGNLDLELQDAGGKSLATSSTLNDCETILFPVAKGATYYIKSFTPDGSLNLYDLLVDNIAINPPDLVDLQASFDSGRLQIDDYTNSALPRFVVQADLRKVVSGGLLRTSSAPTTTTGVRVVGIISDVFTGTIVDQSVIDPVGSSGFLFSYRPPILSSKEYVANAYVSIIDSNGVETFTRLSPPLLFTIDRVNPTGSSADLASSSDSGYRNDDDITRINAPTFIGTVSEPSAFVTVFADGVPVGQGTASSDGDWEVQVQPLSDGLHFISVQYEDLAGNHSAFSPDLVIFVDTAVPNTPFLSLKSDSGRSNVDNVTNVNRPLVSITGSDVVSGSGNPEPNRIAFRLYDRTGFQLADERLLLDSFTELNSFTTLGSFTRTLTQTINSPVGTPLSDGVHGLKLEIEDEAGNISPDFLLEVTIDTVAPAPPSLRLDPSSTDTGIPTSQSSYVDRVTKETVPGFEGRTEPSAIIKFSVDASPISNNFLDVSDIFAGQVMAAPIVLSSGTIEQLGVYRHVSTLSLNDPSQGFPVDGQRQVGASAEDLAGNVSEPAFLDILVDTTPAKVTAVNFPNGTSVFATKPQLAPSPTSTSLLVTFAGGPAAAAGLSTPAVDTGLATDVRNYKLVGDHSGTILVGSVALMGANPDEVTVRLNFTSPLPDDRFTLTILDAVSDAAGNLLDGDSQASSPGGTAVVLPSGNGLPGGNFQARFTVDSRPELGVVGQGLVYVDVNGNSEWDPTGSDNDATNRDFVFQFGSVTDGHFAGNFAVVGAAKASGFDKLGVYGKVGPAYSFLIDTNDDGVGDFASTSAYQVNAIPVAGNFNAAHPGDEIGMFDGSYWYLDFNGNNTIDLGERISSNFTGIPLVGDFNGDGQDDLATYRNDTNTFYFDLDRTGAVDKIWEVRDTVKRFGGLAGFSDKPMAGDINLDGIDDIGLWTKNNGAILPANSGEAFFWVSDRRAAEPALVFDAYSPAPLGNDLFMQFGSENALPVFGNFDPPVADVVLPPVTGNYLHRAEMPLDVNGDNLISPLDALIVINALNSHWETEVVNPARAAATFGNSKVDTSGDAIISPRDALLVINALRQRNTGGEGELSTTVSTSSPTTNPSAVDYYFADLSETLSVKKRRVR